MADVILRDARYIRHSEKAVLICWRAVDFWLPFTQVKLIPQEWTGAPESFGRVDHLVVSEWIAEQKGLLRDDFNSEVANGTQVQTHAILVARIKQLETELAAARSSQSASDRRLNEANRRAEDAERRAAAAEAATQRADSTPSAASSRRRHPLTGTAAVIAAQQAAAQASNASAADKQEAHRFNLLEVE
jgi:hypothetical protein